MVIYIVCEEDRRKPTTAPRTRNNTLFYFTETIYMSRTRTVQYKDK